MRRENGNHSDARTFVDTVPPVSKMLGTKIQSLDGNAGTATLRFTAAPEFCNPAGVIQGGMLAAMLDEAMAVAAVASRDFKYYVPTLEMKVSYLRPVLPGTVTVSAKVIHGGKSAAFAEAQLFNLTNELAASASCTVMFRDRAQMQKQNRTKAE